MNIIAQSIKERFQNAWNVFINPEKKPESWHWYTGYGSQRRLDKVSTTKNVEKSIVASIYNQIALDCAAITIQHVRLDEKGNFKEVYEGSLNDIFNLSANTDQTGRSLIHELVLTMFDDGVVALVPENTSDDIWQKTSYDIYSMRVARIIEWLPKHIKVRMYNEKTGRHEQVLIPKRCAAIIENPFYMVMNESNSILKRLVQKLDLLDSVDKQSGSGKLDLIFQLPYSIKGEIQQRRAEERKTNIERQLTDSKYGIAYIDATEKVTQLNRPAENNLMSQIEYLTSMLYSQLGMTKEIFDGTADEATMINYINRTINTILSVICLEVKRKFLTVTARTQGQSIMFFRDPFKLVPMNEMANVADKFTRNEILSSNEMRAILGISPSSDPRADELRNKNLNAKNDQLPSEPPDREEIE